MSDLILHHYPFSPFGEKVRLALGHKRLAWRSAEVPPWPPRPGTDPLTAGYRRSPVLQVGADVYADTLLILRELDRRHPTPTLYPGHPHGLIDALAAWIDTSIFMPCASVTTSVVGDQVPAELITDRIAFMRHDFSKAPSVRDLPLNRQKSAVVMTMLADLLRDGRPFLLGAALSAADLAGYHMMWFTQQNGGAEAMALLPFAPLLGWMERVAATGHGTPQPIDADAALDVARDAEPAPAPSVAGDDPSGLKGGERVEVRCGDPDHPIAGVLVGADAERIVLRHEHPRVGSVHLHLPRIGYQVVAAG